MGCIDGLIPARFLCLISHLSLLVIILWSREENLKACLPYEYEELDLKSKDQEILIGLSAALGLIGFEMFGFLSGISMFFPCVSLISVASHSIATILLSYYVTDVWDCHLYWWIFSFCSVIPATLELGVFCSIILKKDL